MRAAQSYRSRWWWVGLLIGCLPVSLVAADIQVNALFSGGAILTIDGQRQRLNVGEVSPEGVRLLAADPGSAQVEIAGQIRVLTLADARFGGDYRPPAVHAVRVTPDARGAYLTSGTIDGKATQFLIDTGATLVTVSEASAQGMGLLLGEGEPLLVETAQGQVLGRRVRLRSVRIGGIERVNVEAVLMPGGFPQTPLLGMSFLGQIRMRTEANVMVLEASPR